MFTSLQIKNFRGIREAHLQGFEMLNLLWGENDCGKTTVLESLFLLSGPTNPRLSVGINIFREFPDFEESDLKYLFYRLDESFPIKLEASNEKVRILKISPIHSDPSFADEQEINQSNPPKRLYGLSFDFEYDSASYHSELHMTKDSDSKRTLLSPKSAENYSERLRTRFIYSGLSFSNYVELLKEIVANNDKAFILNSLKRFDSRVQGWDLIDSVVMIDIGLGGLVPINIMGNGIKRLLGVLATIYSCKDGMVFIDEIDNGVHFSHFYDIWRSIKWAAKAYHVQVFATTHSLDCLKGFSEVLQVEAQSESGEIGKGFVLKVNSDGLLECESFTDYQMRYAVANDFDLR